MPSELILRFLIKPGVMLFFIRDNVTDALFGYAEMGRMAIATQGMGRGIKPGTYHKIPISLPTTSFKFAIYSDAGSCYKKCMPTLTRELPTGLAAQANARCAHCTIVASDNRLQSCTKCKNNHCAECISPTCKSCGHSSLGNIKSFMETNMESLKLMPPDAIEQIVAETTHFNSVEDFKKHIHKMTRYIRRRRARRISKKADEQAEEEEEELEEECTVTTESRLCPTTSGSRRALTSAPSSPSVSVRASSCSRGASTKPCSAEISRESGGREDRGGGGGPVCILRWFKSLLFTVYSLTVWVWFTFLRRCSQTQAISKIST